MALLERGRGNAAVEHSGTVTLEALIAESYGEEDGGQ
jgi:hypothetical protein